MPAMSCLTFRHVRQLEAVAARLPVRRLPLQRLPGLERHPGHALDIHERPDSPPLHRLHNGSLTSARGAARLIRRHHRHPPPRITPGLVVVQADSAGFGHDTIAHHCWGGPVSGGWGLARQAGRGPGEEGQAVVTDTMTDVTNPRKVAPDSVAAQLIAQARAEGVPDAWATTPRSWATCST